jgi:hypothetical protein
MANMNRAVGIGERAGEHYLSLSHGFKDYLC